jgi:phage terminase large subunit
MQQVNKVYKPLFLNKNKRYFICMGGRSAGRSYSASQYAVANLRAPEYFRCAIMRFVLGDIRNSIYQEIADRIEEQELDNEIRVREHDMSFYCGDNSIKGVGFRKSSGEQKSKLKSLANYTTVIIEEADEVSEEDFMQLDDSLRTIKSDIKIILLLNAPPKNHWIIKRWFNLVESEVEGFYLPILKESARIDTEFIYTSYKDNVQNMADTTIANFKRYKETNPDHFFNMIEGLVSEGARGRIFKNWQITTNKIFDELPFKSYYALDFGFTNDPTALIEIKEHNEKVWFRELLYETGLTNPLISKRFKSLGLDKKTAVIYADSAEPKSIQELRDDGWDVRPAVKGQDSIRAGLDMLLSKEIFYTEESMNLAKENQEYKWALDKNKEPTNDPIDDFNHLMDAGRYGVYSKSQEGFVGFV